jgi:hypothetical protein
MPESDRAKIRRRRYELSGPEAISEISHIPRGDSDSATTFGGILNSLCDVIGNATFPHRIVQRFQARSGHQIRVRRVWPIRQLDLRSRFGAFFPGEGPAHCLDFSSSRPSHAEVLGKPSRKKRRCFGVIPKDHRLGLSTAFFNEENESAPRFPKQSQPRTETAVDSVRGGHLTSRPQPS